ncbi:hypothetical protein LOD99_13433 [Oopsacas minuta]|uniref:PH domain-containing protein n=1 Tax=Oopsacas minuta TaxID=111878 RepID=A0AAV7KKQ1_9METZ|nr:hypothetical protein LOD99_13433 [Oopsacas minuta]
MAAKVFGYQLFPSKLFELDLANDEKNETQKEIKSMLQKDPSLALNSQFTERNNTYAVIPPFPIFYHTRAQTSLLRSVFLCLQENNTNEKFFECSFDHFKCKSTRIEHFIQDVYALFQPITKGKKKPTPEIPWMNEGYVQRFYNNSMTFKEFGDSLLAIFDFKAKTSWELVTLCWKTYNREIFHKFSDNTLVTKIEEENLRKLFEIFTHLDNNMMCRLSPFILYQFITWWISESGVKPIKETQQLAEWYKITRSDYKIYFPEFLKQIHRLYFSGVPHHIYKTLILDAWDSIVSGVIKKGVLEKVGPNKGRWLSRVMHLHIDRIDYFKKKSDGSYDSRGTIHLGPKSSVVEIFSEDKIGFFQLVVVCSESMRRFLLRCDDQRIRHIWVTSIRNVLDVMKGAMRPMSLEKPVKFIEDTKGDLVKLRSATEVSGVNTLDGKQIVFNKRHSDDFTQHFKIHFPPPLRRSSSFSRMRNYMNEDERSSVCSKASTMSGCMDLTLSPHPGQEFRFFSSNKFDLINERSPSPTGSSDCSGVEYESMKSTAESLRRADSSNIEFHNDFSFCPKPMAKSHTIDDGLNSSGDSFKDFQNIPNTSTGTPVPKPRKKVTASISNMKDLKAIPQVPPRRLPQPPSRLSSRGKIYENTGLLLNQL